MTGREISPVMDSAGFELMAETVFLSSLMQEMWFGRHQLMDVLHSTVDAFGYDLVLQTGDVTRHVQLKTKRRGGSTSTCKLQTQLLDQPAACVVLMEWEPSAQGCTLDVAYRWFGGGPHEAIPDLGDLVAKHSRGNAQGVKGPREGLRIVKLNRFVPVASVAELAFRMFGEVKVD
ncbi:MAG TPA: hypothetical protein VIH37_10435 [Candidatus Limnocylindrales bacterium]